MRTSNTWPQDPDWRALVRSPPASIAVSSTACGSEGACADEWPGGQVIGEPDLELVALSRRAGPSSSEM